MIVLLLRRRGPIILAPGLERGRDALVTGGFPLLVLREGDHLAIGEEGLNGIVYDLTVEVEGYVQERSTSASDNPSVRIGPALNALYGRVLITTLPNPSLSGLCDDVREGELVTDISTEAYTTASAVFSLGLHIRYLDTGAAGRRAAILTGLVNTLAANTDPAALTRREVVLAALATQLDVGLSHPVERNRRAAVNATGATFRHVALYDGNQDARFTAMGMQDYVAEPFLELTVTAATAETLGAAMDGLYSDVRGALYADRTLGGTAFSLTDSTLDVIEHEAPASAPVLRARLGLTIDYLTHDVDPTRIPAAA
jgi:hypothetical protein